MSIAYQSLYADDPVITAQINDTIEAVVCAALHAYPITREQLFHGGKATPLVRARHEIWMAIHLGGINCADICRHFRFNHASVLHGIGVVRANPERLARAQTLARVGTPATLHVFLARELARVPDEHRNAITAYVFCTLLCKRRHAPTLCMWGLALLADGDYRRAVNSALTACGLGENVGRLDLQMRNAKGRAA